MGGFNIQYCVRIQKTDLGEARQDADDGLRLQADADSGVQRVWGQLVLVDAFGTADGFRNGNEEIVRLFVHRRDRVGGWVRFCLLLMWTYPGGFNRARGGVTGWVGWVNGESARNLCALAITRGGFSSGGWYDCRGR